MKLVETIVVDGVVYNENMIRELVTTGGRASEAAKEWDEWCRDDSENFPTDNVILAMQGLAESLGMPIPGEKPE